MAGREEVIGVVGACTPPGLQVLIVGTLLGPTQGLTSFNGDSTNTRKQETDVLLGTFEGQDQAEATIGVPSTKLFVGTREGPWDVAKATVKQEGGWGAIS